MGNKKSPVKQDFAFLGIHTLAVAASLHALPASTAPPGTLTTHTS